MYFGIPATRYASGRSRGVCKPDPGVYTGFNYQEIVKCRFVRY